MDSFQNNLDEDDKLPSNDSQTVVSQNRRKTRVNNYVRNKKHSSLQENNQTILKLNEESKCYSDEYEETNKDDESDSSEEQNRPLNFPDVRYGTKLTVSEVPTEFERNRSNRSIRKFFVFPSYDKIWQFLMENSEKYLKFVIPYPENEEVPDLFFNNFKAKDYYEKLPNEVKMDI
jgi:hypothetical protein